MSELRTEAVPLTIAIPTRRVSGRLAELRSFVSGLLFTAAVAVAGTALFTALLVVGVVASPLVAAAVAWVVVRHRRPARQRTWAAIRPV